MCFAVLGAIALCLFPLWPEIVRVGVYYVSLTAAGFVGFILSLVVGEEHIYLFMVSFMNVI
jgi:translocation protein SEC62